MMYKMINGICPDSRRGRFICRSEMSRTYSTRNQLNIDTARQNLEFSKGSFFHSVAKTWNEIPRNIMSPTISMFKRNVKGFLYLCFIHVKELTYIIADSEFVYKDFKMKKGNGFAVIEVLG